MNKLSMVDVLPPQDYARGYVAGFFDADGSVGLYMQNNRPSPSIAFTNTHVHVLMWMRTLVFQLEEIDGVHEYPKERKIKIFRWDEIEKFVDIFKNLCIVKREQLQLLDEAVKKHRELVKHRRGRRKLYSEQDIEEFRRIAQRIKQAKADVKKNWELRIKGYFPF